MFNGTLFQQTVADRLKARVRKLQLVPVLAVGALVLGIFVGDGIEGASASLRVLLLLATAIMAVWAVSNLVAWFLPWLFPGAEDENDDSETLCDVAKDEQMAHFAAEALVFTSFVTGVCLGHPTIWASWIWSVWGGVYVAALFVYFVSCRDAYKDTHQNGKENVRSTAA